MRHRTSLFLTILFLSFTNHSCNNKETKKFDTKEVLAKKRGKESFKMNDDIPLENIIGTWLVENPSGKNEYYQTIYMKDGIFYERMCSKYIDQKIDFNNDFRLEKVGQKYLHNNNRGDYTIIGENGQAKLYDRDGWIDMLTLNIVDKNPEVYIN